MRLILVGAVLVAALTGCSAMRNAQCGLDAALGADCNEETAYWFRWTVPTVTFPEIHVPISEKIGGPPI